MWSAVTQEISTVSHDIGLRILYGETILYEPVYQWNYRSTKAGRKNWEWSMGLSTARDLKKVYNYMYFISKSIILYTVTDATITEIKNGKRTSLFTTARDWDWLRQKNLQLRSKYGGKNCIKSVQLWNQRIVHDSEVSVLRNCSTHIIIKVNTYT